jgi:hypothetical protein
MLSELVKHISTRTGLPQKTSRAALGIVLNAAERQGSSFASEVYEKIPGARTLAASMGDHVGAATGVIARLIEQTPGGRRQVADEMIRNLQKEGLGSKEIGALLPAIGAFADTASGVSRHGNSSDVFGGFETAMSGAARAA